MTARHTALPESLSIERLEPRYALSALGLALPQLSLAPLAPVLSAIPVETSALTSSGSGGTGSTSLGSTLPLGSVLGSTGVSLGGGSLGLNVSLLGQTVAVNLQPEVTSGGLDLGLQVASSLGVNADLNVGVGGSSGLLDVGLGASVGQLLQTNVGLGAGGGELLGLSVDAAALGGAVDLGLGAGVGGDGLGGVGLGGDISLGGGLLGGAGATGGVGIGIGIPGASLPGAPSPGIDLTPNLSPLSATNLNRVGGLADALDESDAESEDQDTLIGAPGDDELFLEDLASSPEKSADVGASGGDSLRAVTASMGDSALMGRALPMLLMPNLSAHGISELAADLVDMAATANAAELAAFESALAQFLGELETLQAELAAADLGLVPWILTASVAAIAAGEIVRRERRARRSRPQSGAAPGLCLA